MNLKWLQNKTDNTDSQTDTGMKNELRCMFAIHKLPVDDHLQHLLMADNLRPEKHIKVININY